MILNASEYVAELRQVTPRPRAEKVVRCAGDKALKDRWNSVGKTGSSASRYGWHQHGMNMASMFFCFYNFGAECGGLVMFSYGDLWTSKASERCDRHHVFSRFTRHLTGQTHLDTIRGISVGYVLPSGHEAPQEWYSHRNTSSLKAGFQFGLVVRRYSIFA